MPFFFKYVADLLEQLYSIQHRDPRYLPKDSEAKSTAAISNWFQRYRRYLNDDNGEALLSTLLPERRTDRVYGIKEKSLENIIGRIMCLSTARRLDLARYQEPGAGDLADCVERVQKQADVACPFQGNEVTIEQVDSILLKIASHNRFSSPDVTALIFQDKHQDSVTLLTGIFMRLQAREAKWFIRLILKNYSPVIIPEHVILRSYHGLLPSLLKVQDTFPAAIALLRSWKSSSAGETDILKRVRPQIGTKIGRQTFLKARSIKHCVDMAQNRRMSVEKKYDGEYCQIHINMKAAHSKRVKIFSKSGKDSTKDRSRVHSNIIRSLRLNEKDCVIQESCTLEGELLVYNDIDCRISSFHKIRKHVLRSGMFFGIEQDSPAHEHEHLMIVFFDILMHDKKHVLGMKQINRRKLLETIVTVIPGRAELAETSLLSFSSIDAAQQLRSIFAKCVVNQDEGLIIKPADEPYFDLNRGSLLKSCCIKLKKGYVGSFGDVGDFCVVGASYCAMKAKEYSIPNLKWTHFWLACLDNRENVSRWNATPHFVVVAVVSPNKQIIKSLLAHGNPCPKSPDDNCAFSTRIERGIAQGRTMTTVFTSPLIFDMRCFAFDKEGDTGFWTLRFPQVSKFHQDRSYLDAITFSELQELADAAEKIPTNGDSQQDIEWIRKLESADPRGIAVDASSQEVSRPMLSPGPILSPQNTGGQSSELSTTRLSMTKATQGYIFQDQLSNFDMGVDEQPLRLTSQDSALIMNKRQRTPSNDDVTHRKKPMQSAPCLTSSQMSNTDPILEITLFTSHQFQTNRKPLEDCSNFMNAQRNSPAAIVVNNPSQEDIGRWMGHSATQSFIAYAAPSTVTRSKSTRLSVFESCLTTEGEENLCSNDKVVRKDVAETADMALNAAFELCKVLLDSCPLASCSLCLAPCIASFPWITENLCSHHGISFTTDLVQWLGSTTRLDRPCQHKKRFRMIFLVDSNRKAQTLHALRDMEVLLRKHRAENDNYEIIEVYDWRLLESFMNFEKRGRLVYNGLWREHWVGAL